MANTIEHMRRVQLEEVNSFKYPGYYAFQRLLIFTSGSQHRSNGQVDQNMGEEKHNLDHQVQFV